MDPSNYEEMQQLVLQARQTFELLLTAWAKYENDLPDSPRKFKPEESRIEWGRNARLILMDELDDNE